MIKYLKQNLSYLTLYYKTIRRGLIPLLFLLVIVQLGLMYYQVSSLTYQETVYPLTNENGYMDFNYESTETVEGIPSFNALLNRCHYPTILNIAFLLLFILIAAQPIRNRNNTTRNYTMQRIGISPRRRYFLTAIANFLLLLTVYFIENITLFCSYLIYDAGILENYRMFNGFFQAYVTNGFIRGLCPVTSPLLFLYILGLFGFYAILLSTAFVVSENQHYDALFFFMIIFLGCVLVISPEYLNDSYARYQCIIFAAIILLFNFWGLHNDQYYKYEQKER